MRTPFARHQSIRITHFALDFNMNTGIKLPLGLLILLFVSASLGQPASMTNFTKSVHYIPPANFQLEDYMRDSGGEKDWPTDLFLSIWGQGFSMMQQIVVTRYCLC